MRGAWLKSKFDHSVNDSMNGETQAVLLVVRAIHSSDYF